MNRANDLYFLRGGGAMGALIRSTDWSKTPLGAPEHWPQSLQTAVAIMLDNPFGMYIAWGPEYIQMYNDGYRPILGNTKHPRALGISTRQTFEEIWHIIGSMFDDVMQGKAVGFPDFMLPLNRNGFVEECYFDFSYSPIRKNDGEVGGVLVTVIETTGKRKAVRALEDSEEKIRSLVESAPFPIGVYVGREMKIELANQAIKDIWGKGDDVVGKLYTEILPELESQEIFDQLDDVFTTGNPLHKKNQRVDLVIGGKLKPYYFNYSFTPLQDSTGKVYGVMNTAADVTDLNLAKLKIEESENKLRNTILKAPIAMCIFRGPHHVVELANDLMYALWGKPAEAILNKPLFEGLHESKGQGFEELLDSVYNTGKTVREEGVPVSLPRGEKMEDFFVNVLYQPYRDIDGTITGILAIAVDVTQQVLAQRTIAEAEAKARVAIDSAELGVYEVSYATNEVITDERYREIMEVGERFDWKEGSSFIHPDDLKTREEAHKVASKTGQLDYKARVLLKDKSLRWVRLTGKIIFDETQSPSKLIGVVQDITASVIAQNEIEEREKTIRNMVRQAPVAMCILRGPSLIVDIANNNMFAIWGKEESDVINKPIFEGLPEAREQGLETILATVLLTGERFVANERPVKLPRKGRIETTYLNFVYEPFKKGDGAIIGVIAVAVDVSAQVLARHKIEEIVLERTKDLAEANLKLTKSNAELEQFAHIASHDLQEPLRKITTFAQMLEKSLREGLDDQSRKYLDKINNSSSRMHTLIRDVLTYSEVVKEKEEFITVDLNQILASVKTDFDLLIEQKQATIVSEKLPVIEAVPLQMSQLFTNLIGNALKFMKPDVKPIIRIDVMQVTSRELQKFPWKHDVDYYNVRFSDNGIGIKPDYNEQIFNIFQRLHRKSEFEGTGIGLALCKKIALNHQGDINAIGSNENGAVFNVILPARQ